MYLADKGIGVGLQAPDFVLASYSGHNYRLSDYFGKTVLLFFIRETRHPEAGRQIRQICGLHKAVSYLAQIVVVIEQDGRRKNARSARDYVENNSVPFPVLIDPDGTVLEQFVTYRLFGLEGYQLAHSNVFLISPQQHIIYNYVGEDLCDSPNVEILMAESYKLYNNVHPGFEKLEPTQIRFPNVKQLQVNKVLT